LPRKWLAPRFNITRWTTMPRGGHFAAFEQPELLVEVVRAFFWGPAIATAESKVNLTGR
jgi:pimeloyl-ACP methyl ester carboxylesterase